MALELLAPAGDLNTAIKALQAGADAVYLGLDQFSARSSAVNFSQHDLRRLLAFTKNEQKESKKVFVALNTVIKENEMEEALSLLAFLQEVAVDAVIMQDVGLIRLARQFFPALTLHASTQMALGTPHGLLMAKELGMARVILPRETTVSEAIFLGQVAKELSLELEMFVQGALCYSFSGLCLMSGKEIGVHRSGNRGACAQLCRSYYQQGQRLFYPFSCNDMSLGEDIKRLAAAGIMSFKIEGRLKSADYVVENVQYYRQWLDHGIDRGTFRLKQHFARAFSACFSKNESGEQLINTDYPKNLGQKVGTISAETQGKDIRLNLDDEWPSGMELSAGDRLLFLKAGFNEKGQAALVSRSVTKKKEMFIQLQTPLSLAVGDKVSRIDCAGLTAAPKIDYKNFPLLKKDLAVAISLSVTEQKIHFTVKKQTYSFPLPILPAEKNKSLFEWREQWQHMLAKNDERLWMAQIVNFSFAEGEKFFIASSAMKKVKNDFYRVAVDENHQLVFKAPPYEQKAIKATLFDRSLFTLKDGTPFAHLSHLHLKDLALFARVEGKVVIPCLPIIHPKEEEQYVSAFLQLLASYPQESFLIGIDHLSHIPFARCLQREHHHHCQFFLDGHIYVANSAVLASYHEWLNPAPPLAPLAHFAYYEETSATGMPLMIARGCFKKHTQTGCAKCERRFPYQYRIKNQQREYLIHIYDCVTYVEG